MSRCVIPLLTILLTLAAGCTDGADSPTGDSGLEDGGPNTMDGATLDGGTTSDAGADGSTSGDATLPPGAEVPEWLTDCEREQILLLVNDAYVWGYQLVAMGLEDDLSWSIVNRRNGPDRRYGTGDDNPFSSLTDLATVPGLTDAVWRLLADGTNDGCALPDETPSFEVRFTSPQCAAIPDRDIAAGVRCYGSSDERDASAEAAGVVSKIISWVNSARRIKEAHPERDVRILMAYLSWSNSAVYRAICRATAAGVRFEGYFDAGAAGGQPQRLAGDADCNPDNIDVHLLGGVTDYPNWRLMHIKLLMLETGEPSTRLAFGSANLTSTGVSLHHENWVFSRFPAESHFVASHDCARQALYADRYAEDGSYPEAFRTTYDACVAALPGTEDPNYRVIFSPDTEAGPMDEAISLIDRATTRVDMAIQHFSAFPLGSSLRRSAAREGVTSRLLLDDDTYYNGGDTGGVDFALYEYLTGEPLLDIKFLQTNRFLSTRSWQYQHNKFIIADDAVFCGAGNFTVVAFEDNYENFYLIRDAAFLSAFEEGFTRLYGLATDAMSLPAEEMY